MIEPNARFVLFPLAGERYVLDSTLVSELVMGTSVHTFPHTMQGLEGVLVRRGRLIPICDLRAAFGHGIERNLYIIARCNYQGRPQTIALPVNGQCELVAGERQPSPTEVTFVIGLLRTLSGTFPLLDLDRVVSHCVQPARVLAWEAKV